MNYLKCDTVGIDTTIKGLQEHLYNKICDRWSLQEFDGYGRVYKNKRNSLVIPETYISEKEYKEVLLDDTRNGIMFFSPSDFSNVYDGLIVQNCDVIFTFNLASLEFSDERIDEEIRQYTLSLLNTYVKQQNVTNVVTGLGNVYRDYNGVADYFYDMQDFHHFKITLELRYQNKNCI